MRTRPSLGFVLGFFFGILITLAYFLFYSGSPASRAVAIVHSKIEKYYVGEIDESKLTKGSLRGLVNGLEDPFSSYLGPESFKEINIDADGSFGGIGISMEVRDGTITVVAPLPGTPGARSGMRTGDRIITINSQESTGIDIREALRRLRGDPGSLVKLGVYREREEKFIEFDIVREIITIPVLFYHPLPGGFHYLKINTFSRELWPQMVSRIREIESHARVTGVIIDLRQSPGGLLDDALRLADLFVSRGQLLSVEGKGGKILDSHFAGAGAVLSDVPMVVLIDEGTASAAEIFAGILRDLRQVPLIGRRSFGKGSIQRLLPLGENGGVKITIGKYILPLGERIHGVGLKPTIPITNSMFDTATARSISRIFRDGILRKIRPGKETFGNAERSLLNKKLSDQRIFLSPLAIDYIIHREEESRKGGVIPDLRLDLELRTAVRLIKNAGGHDAWIKWYEKFLEEKKEKEKEKKDETKDSS